MTVNSDSATGLLDYRPRCIPSSRQSVSKDHLEELVLWVGLSLSKMLEVRSGSISGVGSLFCFIWGAGVVVRF